MNTIYIKIENQIIKVNTQVAYDSDLGDFSFKRIGSPDHWVLASKDIENNFIMYKPEARNINEYIMFYYNETSNYKEYYQKAYDIFMKKSFLL